MRMDPVGWLDVSAWLIMEINYVLDSSCFVDPTATNNNELLAIIEVFKTERHCLEGYEHEVLMLPDLNNLQWFMDTKSLSSR